MFERQDFTAGFRDGCGRLITPETGHERSNFPSLTMKFFTSTVHCHAA